MRTAFRPGSIVGGSLSHWRATRFLFPHRQRFSSMRAQRNIARDAARSLRDQCASPLTAASALRRRRSADTEAASTLRSCRAPDSPKLGAAREHSKYREWLAAASCKAFLEPEQAGPKPSE